MSRHPRAWVSFGRTVPSIVVSRWYAHGALRDGSCCVARRLPLRFAMADPHPGTGWHLLVQRGRALPMPERTSRKAGVVPVPAARPELPVRRQVELARAPVHRALDAIEPLNETFAIERVASVSSRTSTTPSPATAHRPHPRTAASGQPLGCDDGTQTIATLPPPRADAAARRIRRGDAA